MEGRFCEQVTVENTCCHEISEALKSDLLEWI
jgi:hypothetical protein